MTQVAVKRLTFEMSAERAAVAKIHVSELPDSPLSALGEAFLYRFYYGSLLKEPGYFCYVYTAEGRVAGFAAFATDTRKACRGALRRSWPVLGWTLAAQAVRRPSAAKAAVKLARSFFTSPTSLGADIPAEAMSTAVAAPYRSVDFFRRTGINLGHALYRTIAEVLHEQGVRQVKGSTRPSNLLVNASLNFLGWKKIGTAGGSHLWVWDIEAALKKKELQ